MRSRGSGQKSLVTPGTLVTVLLCRVDGLLVVVFLLLYWSFHHWVFLSGEREEVHAASGQPEAERRGEGLHVQQTRLCHLQHRTEVWML